MRDRPPSFPCECGAPLEPDGEDRFYFRWACPGCGGSFRTVRPFPPDEVVDMDVEYWGGPYDGRIERKRFRRGLPPGGGLWLPDFASDPIRVYTYQASHRLRNGRRLYVCRVK